MPTSRTLHIASLLKTGAIVLSFLSASIGLGAHGIAYLKAQEAKVRSQALIEDRLAAVEHTASHTELLMEKISGDYVSQAQLGLVEKRQDELLPRVLQLQQSIDSISMAVTRIALRTNPTPH